MKKLDDYFKLQKEIFDYFGYVEDWVVIPLDDATDFFWCLDKNEDNVLFALIKENVFEGTDEDVFSNEVYRQRFLKKWVYRGKDYTMICVDTHTDGNKFFAFFSNNKEVK